MGDTHLVAPGSFCHIVPPLDHERPALRRAGPGLRGGAPAAVDGEGTQVASRGATLSGHTPLPQWRRGGTRAVPPAEGLVERGPRHCQALHGRQHPPAVCSRSPQGRAAHRQRPPRTARHAGGGRAAPGPHGPARGGG